MKIINKLGINVLDDKTTSLFRMPGGEWHIKGRQLDGHHILVVQGGEDIVQLPLVSDAIRRDSGTVSIVCPYLPGARQDRKQPGEALSAAVYADIINMCGAKTVSYFDPHSYVMPALIHQGFETSLSEICQRILGDYDISAVVAPDIGAHKRASAVATALGAKLIQATKERNPTTGHLSNFSVPLSQIPNSGTILVVDDICDGGGTFTGLAITMGLPRERVELLVSHGVFSKGAERLGQYYRLIHTTNSHVGADFYNTEILKNLCPPSAKFEVKVYDILSYLVECEINRANYERNSK
jgi:ribose-phosphate pyrophosphokinase